MLLTSIACVALSMLNMAPYQSAQGGVLRIEKSDTLPDVLNKLSAVTKKKILVDGSVSKQKRELEGDFTQDALLAQLKDSFDYDYVANDDAVLFFKSFSKEDTRPDYSLPEILASLKDIKAILAPIMVGKTGQEFATGVFREAVKGLGPDQAKQLESEEGILIGSLPPATQEKVIAALYFREYKGVFRELGPLFTLIDTLDSLTMEKQTTQTPIDSRTSLTFESNKDTSPYRIYVSSPQAPPQKSPLAPQASARLEDLLSTDRQEYSFKLSGELADHALLALSDARLNPKDIKLLAELNRWNVRPDARQDKIIYSIARKKPGASTNLSIRMLEALPASVSRYLMGPLTHIEKTPLPDSKDPGMLEYAKILRFSSASEEIKKRAEKISDSDIRRVTEWLESKKTTMPVPLKDAPPEIKQAVINGLLMRAFSGMSQELVTRSVLLPDHLMTPEKCFLQYVETDTYRLVAVKNSRGLAFFERTHIFAQ